MATAEHTFLINLINAVKEYPQIYDYKKYPPGIRDTQNECSKIWTIIGKQLGESRELCKRKWQVVRGSYQRYLKQIDIAKVPYYLSGHMEFLLPIYSNRFKPETHKLVEENIFENTYSTDDDNNNEDDGNVDDNINDNVDDNINDNNNIEIDIVDNIIIENKSNNNNDDDDDEDWSSNILKHEINDHDNDNNDIQPFESVSIEEDNQLTNKINELKLPDTKYVNDMPFAIKLLNCIKKYPDLYATDSCKCSGDPSFIWGQISNELGETKELCRKKWRIIRGSYQRYLKKIDTAPTPYYLNEYMKFLLPYYGNKYLPKSHRYLINEYLGNDKYQDNNNDNNDDDDDNNSIEYTDEYLDEINFIDINKRKLNDDENNLGNIKSTQLKKIKIENNNNNEDDYEDNGDLIFLKSLLPDLKLLDTNKKITFRISVLNLVKELLEKK